MSTQSHVSPFRHMERRRSERLPFRETLFVCGRSQGRRFKEETLTLSVSAHGALVELYAMLSLGQKLLLMNPQTWDEREAHVTRLGKGRNGRAEVAVEFAKPAPDFWPLNIPARSLPLKHAVEAVISVTPAPTPVPSLSYEWQQAVFDALTEFRPELLPSKTNAAQRAIAARLRDRTPVDLEERIALQDALRSLGLIMPGKESPQQLWRKHESA